MDDDSIFRPMQAADVATALKIIHDHDEDDFEWAQATYADSLYGQYVLEKDSQVIGVSGAKPIEGTERAFAISWTYLTRDFKGRGHGRTLLENMIGQIQSEGCRKVFVNTSDYVDAEDGDMYRDAREAYRAVGFSEELRHRDYYDKNESMLTYGLRLEEFVSNLEHPSNTQQIRLTDVDEIPECEGAYWLAWELADEGTDPASLQMIVEQVQEWKGRVIFMAFPSDLASVSEFMTRCRFKRDGELQDYYDDGVDEIHYRYDVL